MQMPLSWDWHLIAEQCSPGRLAAWGECCLAHLAWPRTCRVQGFLAHAVCILDHCSPRIAASSGRHHYSPIESINTAFIGSVVFFTVVCHYYEHVWDLVRLSAVLEQSLLVLLQDASCLLAQMLLLGAGDEFRLPVGCCCFFSLSSFFSPLFLCFSVSFSCFPPSVLPRCHTDPSMNLVATEQTCLAHHCMGCYFVCCYWVLYFLFVPSLVGAGALG